MLKVLFSGTVYPYTDADNDIMQELIDIWEAIEYTDVVFIPIIGECVADFLSRIEINLGKLLLDTNYSFSFHWDHKFYWEIGVATFTDEELKLIQKYLLVPVNFSQGDMLARSAHEKLKLALKEIK